jgi:very-short-patch-repair endonuclease
MRSRIKGGHYLSAPEARVCEVLNALDLDYQIHRLIGPYTVDVYVRSRRLDIECDGAYWHRQRPEHDETRDSYMAENGYRVLRIPDSATPAEIAAVLRDALT